MDSVSPASRIRRAVAAALVPTVALMLLACASAGAAPQARISAVDCDAGGAVVTLSNDAGGPARFVLLRDESVVATVVVPAGGAQVRHVVPIAEGAAAQVTARYGGSYVSGYVRRGCRPQTARVAAPVPASTSPDDAPFETGPVVPATGTRAALRSAPVTEPAPERAERAAVDVGSPWTVPGFVAVAVIALTALARMLSRGHRGAGTPAPAPERTRRPTRTPST